MRRLLCCLILCIPVLSACRSASPTPFPDALFVDPGTDLGPISPYIYGTNYGPMHAVPLEMIPVVMDLGLTALRYPGGAWGDSVNIKPFQIDMFLDFCNQMGALPTISVRLWGGTPEQAADLVRYTNVEKEYGVIYWSIGNEPTLYEEDTGEVYDTVRFNQEWRAIAEAMKAEDPNIKLMGPELHQWGADLETTLKDSSGRDWMTEFLKANGDLVDVVTVHRYPLWKPVGSPTIQEMRDNTQEWPQLVTYLDGLIQEITGRGIPIAFTEVNSSPTGAIGQESSPDSFYNAIWYADVLGKLIQEDVFMVNHWVISQRSTGHGLIQGTNIRPTLYTFQIYKHFGNQQVYTASDLADVTVYAAKRQDETLTIMVINLSDVEQEVPLKVKGVQPSKADVWLLDSSHNAENLGEQSFTSDNIITLPAQSVTLYAIAP